MNHKAKPDFPHSIGILLGIFVCASPLILFLFFAVMVSPFTGFTFTDAIDFGPVGVIALSFAGLAARHAVRPYSEAWLRFARRAAIVLAVLPPLIYLAALYVLAWYAFRAMGHWPQPMMDDPKLIARQNAAYQNFLQIVDYTEAFAGALLWTWAALLLHLRHHLTVKNAVVLLCLFLVSWLVFLFEPGHKFAWWMD